MNPHSFSFNRKMTDLYSELNKINSNSKPISSNNTFQINQKKKTIILTVQQYLMKN